MHNTVVVLSDSFSSDRTIHVKGRDSHDFSDQWEGGENIGELLFGKAVEVGEREPASKRSVAWAG